jgi:hypothetical protein
MVRTNPLAETFYPFTTTDGGQSLEVHYISGRIKGVREQSASEEYWTKKNRTDDWRKLYIDYRYSYSEGLYGGSALQVVHPKANREETTR